MLSVRDALGDIEPLNVVVRRAVWVRSLLDGVGDEDTDDVACDDIDNEAEADQVTVRSCDQEVD